MPFWRTSHARKFKTKPWALHSSHFFLSLAFAQVSMRAVTGRPCGSAGGPGLVHIGARFACRTQCMVLLPCLPLLHVQYIVQVVQCHTVAFSFWGAANPHA